MINPDGVTLGSARSSLIGCDLNRRWGNPNPLIHPEIYFLKQELAEKTAEGAPGVNIFMDLHGHNKKENLFLYGCNKVVDEGLVSWTKTRLIPKIIASLEPIFDFNSCRFLTDRDKINTARITVWNELKVANSYTLECSLFGKNLFSS